MIRLAYVNQEQLAYEREMTEWLARMVREGLCVSCEEPVTAEEWFEWSLGGRVLLEHVECHR